MLGLGTGVGIAEGGDLGGGGDLDVSLQHTQTLNPKPRHHVRFLAAYRDDGGRAFPE